MYLMPGIQDVAGCKHDLMPGIQDVARCKHDLIPGFSILRVANMTIGHFFSVPLNCTHSS